MMSNLVTMELLTSPISDKVIQYHLLEAKMLVGSLARTLLQGSGRLSWNLEATTVLKLAR